MAMHLDQKPESNRRFELGPGTIALLYAAFSAIWIWFSDIVVNEVQEPRFRLFLVTTKGLLFVLVTATLLYVLVRKLVKQMRETQQSLAASEAEYHGIVQAANEGVCRLDKDDRIGFVNPRMEAWLQRGSEELIGFPLSKFLDELERKAFAQQLQRWRSGATEQHDFRFRAVDGSEIRTIVSGTPVFGPKDSYSGCFLMLLDVTERQRIQEQLQHSQKLEAVGRFAGGIAHDFNNVLGIIVGYTSLLKSRLTEDEVGKDYVNLVLHSCERAAALVRQLLAFSRKQPLVLSVIDLNDTVSNFGKILPRVIGEDVRITIRTDQKPATVRTDPAQIEQVLMNLAANARDAMPEGGALLIETGTLNSSSIQNVEEIPAGFYSCLRVSDSGVGMDAETKSRIFEPFFTTKDVGKGTGLGLSMVYGIVKQSGGYIEVQSQPQQGTSFCIYFPFAEAASPQEQAAPQRGAPMRRGSETILLVEDEPQLRMVTKHILSQHGYRVIEAVDGLDALEICEKHLAEIDLVLSDLVMPKMGGRELASRLAQLKPDLKVVFISGYADDSMLENEITIEKPISPDVLAAKIRQVLD